MATKSVVIPKLGSAPLLGALGRIISSVLWVVVLLCAGLAGLNLLLTSSSDASTPQLAAASVRNVAAAAVPYVLARAWDSLRRF